MAIYTKLKSQEAYGADSNKKSMGASQPDKDAAGQSAIINTHVHAHTDNEDLLLQRLIKWQGP